MKVLIINEADFGGGAAIAAIRTSEALIENTDIEVFFRSKRAQSNRKNQFKISKTTLFINQFIKYTELKILDRLKIDSHDLLNLDLFNFFDFTDTLMKQIDEINPDMINLHWVNNGFLSINQISNIAKKYKVLWTLHDMWPFLGIEHYERSMFQDIKRGKIFKKINGLVLSEKKKIFDNPNIHFGCISNWIQGELIKRWNIEENRTHIIRNTYSKKINDYSPDFNEEIGKSKFTLLVASKSSNTDYRKGYDLLKEVISSIRQKDIELKVLGCNENREYVLGNVTVREFKSTNDQDEIIKHYLTSDLNISFSRMDNYPNTILEANGLFLPTVAFNVGGISDMIEHNHTGFLVSPFNIKQMKAYIEQYYNDINLQKFLKQNLKKRKEINSNSEISLSYQSIINKILTEETI